MGSKTRKLSVKSWKLHDGLHVLMPFNSNTVKHFDFLFFLFFLHCLEQVPVFFLRISIYFKVHFVTSVLPIVESISSPADGNKEPNAANGGRPEK